MLVVANTPPTHTLLRIWPSIRELWRRKWVVARRRETTCGAELRGGSRRTWTVVSSCFPGDSTTHGVRLRAAGKHRTRLNGASVSRRRRLEDGYCATPQPREPCGCGHGQFGQPLGGLRRSGRYDHSARSPKSAALFSRPRAATRISWRNATARKPLPGATLINLGRQCREEKEEQRSGVFSDRSRRKRLPTHFLCLG